MPRLAITNLALVLALSGAAKAQPPTPPPAPSPVPFRPPAPIQPDAYDGRPIRELRLVRENPAAPGKSLPVEPTLDQLIRNQTRSLPGTAFSRVVASEDLTRLNRLGHFKTIESQVQLLADGSVVVIFTFTEQPMIQDVQVVGNRDLSDQEILKSVGIIAGTPIDRFQIDRNARAIEDLYRAKGYYRCRVAVDEQELADSGIVLYRVIEGNRVRVGSIRFEGNFSFSAKELRSPIKTTEFFPIFEKGPLDDDVLTSDTGALMKFYREHGYLDARTSWRVQPSPDGKEAIVTFQVEEGPLYNLRSVRVLYTTPSAVAKYKREVLKDERSDLAYLTADQMLAVGLRPFSDAQAAGLMAIKPGDVYTEGKLRLSQEAIRAAYGKLGWVLDTGRGPESAQVDIQEVRDEKLPLVDLLMFIREGTPARVGEITVIGNETTRQEVIVRQLELKPDRPLDSEALKESTRRIEGLHLFELGSVKLAVQPEDPERPGVRDINAEVRETNTGAVNFGVAVGSDAGVIGQIGIVQRNFDAFAFPHSFDEVFSGQAFRGAGQTFDLEILPGNEVQTYSLTIAEPYFLETDYSASGTVFYSSRIYDGYDENRYGARMGLGRRFGTIWTGNLIARVENVQLFDIDPLQPVDVFDAQGPATNTGLGVELIRNTTNDKFRPWRGSHVSLAAEQIGALGGDYEFTHLRTELTTFFALNESFLGYKTILKLSNRMDYIPQDADDVPVYERVYLGGNSFRGFDFRTISPKGIINNTNIQGNDPVGGTFLFFLGAEVNQPVYKDVVSMVTFIDSGTVEDQVGFDKYRVSAGFGVRLSLSALSPVPLAFDFGFPIKRYSGDDRRLFSFSIDLPYQ